MNRLLVSVLTLGLGLSVLSPVFAQGTAATPANPLKGPASSTAPVTSTPDAKAEKPKRERSDAQKANDSRMKSCGQEWRSNKDKLKAEGKTWRTFNVECRARLKAQGK